MNHLFRLENALLCACLTTLGVAQAQPVQAHPVQTVIMVRCGPSDIVLNEGIAEALLNQASTRDRLQKKFGKAFSEIQEIDATFYGGHAKGTYQIDVNCSIGLGGTWNAEKAKIAKRALTDHLQGQLSEMLYIRPLAELSKQREELQIRMVELQRARQEVSADDSDLGREATRLRLQHDLLLQKLLDVELEVATEEHARDHLAKMRTENLQIRADLRKSIATSDKNSQELQVALRIVRTKLAQAQMQKPTPVTAKATAQADDLDERLAQVRLNLSSWQERAGDVQNLLTLVLEKLPITELTLQRSRARQLSLKTRLARNQEASARLASRIAKSSQRAVARHRLDIDLQVAQERLLEVERQVARMQPVRCRQLQ